MGVMHIKDYIESKNMTVAQAARDFGCTDQSMRYWVSGQRTPRPPKMLALIRWSDGKITAEDFLRGYND